MLFKPMIAPRGLRELTLTCLPYSISGMMGILIMANRVGLPVATWACDQKDRYLGMWLV